MDRFRGCDTTAAVILSQFRVVRTGDERWDRRKRPIFTQIRAEFAASTGQLSDGVAVGTVIIDTAQTYLYYVLGDGTAIRCSIGVDVMALGGPASRPSHESRVPVGFPGR